jgi:crotonobetainyl-CoA:carnitine CoA-transferase CaiB-like acyl-CoA transferase
MPFADGYGIATPTSDADFQGICRALGVEGADDPAVATMVARAVNKDAMQVMMTKLYEASAQLTTAEAIARLEAERVPCGVIIPAAELPDDPHARAIGLFVNSDHPTVGRVRLPRHPTQFSATPAAHQGPSPTLGEHTDAILAELGMGEQTADLRARGVVA